MLPLGDVLVGVEFFLFSFVLVLLLELVFVQQFGQCLPVDAEGEGFKVYRPDVCSLDRADVGVLFVFLHLQYRFRLVAQFGTDMPPCVLVPFVLVQDGMDVDMSFPRPCHQQGYYLCGFTGAVDVVHHVPYSVNDYQPDILGAVDCLPHDCYALFGRVLPQDKKFKVFVVFVCGQSRHAQYPLCDLCAVVGALFGVHIEYFPLVLGQFSRVA